MPLLSTFESPYRRRATLGSPISENEKEKFNSFLNARYKETYDLKKSVFDALGDYNNFCLSIGYDPKLDDIYEYLINSYSGSINEPLVSEGIRLFKINLSRKQQKAQAQAQASEAAAAYAAAMSAQADPVDPEETEPAQAVEVVEAVELPEGLDASELIAIEEATKAVNLDALSIEAQAQAAQAVEAYAEGKATPQQVEAAIDTAAAVEQEKTRNALLNVGLPLTLAVGLFIFFFKGKK